jgi:hypothetical protein
LFPTIQIPQTTCLEGKIAENTVKIPSKCPPPQLGTRKSSTGVKEVKVGNGTANIRKAINHVPNGDESEHAQAYKLIFEHMQSKNHTDKPEMLLLQMKISQLKKPGTLLDGIDSACIEIIGRIVKGINEKDYSISIYVTKQLDVAVLTYNIGRIVHEFSIASLKNAPLLIEYATRVLNISDVCSLIDAFLKELETRQLLDSNAGMHLWAYAKFIREEQANWPNVALSSQKLCTDAIEKLSVNRSKFFKHYQKYVEDPDKQKIKDLHQSSPHLLVIVRDFVVFYYNGEVGRTQNLLAAAIAIVDHVLVSRILSQLHAQIVKNYQQKSFEAFRLFNEVNRCMNLSTFNSLKHDVKITFEHLKKKAPLSVRQLLWPDEEFQVVNKFFNATLTVQEDNSVVCFDSGYRRCNNQTWKITIDEVTSLLTLTHEQKKLQLGQGDNSTACLAEAGERWMVKAVDEHYLKIFCGGSQGKFVLIQGFETGTPYRAIVVSLLTL